MMIAAHLEVCPPSIQSNMQYLWKFLFSLRDTSLKEMLESLYIFSRANINQFAFLNWCSCFLFGTETSPLEHLRIHFFVGGRRGYYIFKSIWSVSWFIFFWNNIEAGLSERLDSMFLQHTTIIIVFFLFAQLCVVCQMHPFMKKQWTIP